MLRSPNKNYALRQLEGDPNKITADATSFVNLATTLDGLAEELQAIGASGVHKSKGTDKLAEVANKSKPEVEKAETRYRGTGKALLTYAPVLRTAQSWINENKASIEAAEASYENAQNALQSAEKEQSSLQRVWSWDAEPPESELTAASNAVTGAQGALNSATVARNAKWEAFETVFTTWSEAYDDAVDGIDEAIEKAGNNDGFWEGLANFLDVLGWVVTVLAIVALFVSGPIGLLIMALVVIGSLVILAGKVAQYATGRTTLADLALAAFGVVTLGAGGAIARVAAKAVPKFSGVVSIVRSDARYAIRTDLFNGGLRARWFNPFSWGKPLVREIRTWSRASSLTPKPGAVAGSGVKRTFLDSVRFGGPETGRKLQFLETAKSNLSAYPKVVMTIDELLKAVTPSVASQRAQTALWASGTSADIGDKMNQVKQKIEDWSSHR